MSRKMVKPGGKINNALYKYFDICHRTAQLRMLCSIILTLIFNVKYFLVTHLH